MGMTIREATAGDTIALSELNCMVQSLHVAARPDIFVPLSPGDLAEWFGTVLASSTHRVWLAEIDGVSAGYLVAVVHERPATPFSVPRRWCEIDQLGVNEAMRGRGVARALVKAAIGWACQQRITRVSAQCWSFNVAAQEAFARLGFAPMTVRLECNVGD